MHAEKCTHRDVNGAWLPPADSAMPMIYHVGSMQTGFTSPFVTLLKGVTTFPIAITSLHVSAHVLVQRATSPIVPFNLRSHEVQFTQVPKQTLQQMK